VNAIFSWLRGILLLDAADPMTDNTEQRGRAAITRQPSDDIRSLLHVMTLDVDRMREATAALEADRASLEDKRLELERRPVRRRVRSR